MPKPGLFVKEARPQAPVRPPGLFPSLSELPWCPKFGLEFFPSNPPLNIGAVCREPTLLLTIPRCFQLHVHSPQTRARSAHGLANNQQPPRVSGWPNDFRINIRRRRSTQYAELDNTLFSDPGHM